MIQINIGCGRTPTKGWVNFDNTPALRLANSPFIVSVLSRFGILDTAQLENIDWNRCNKVDFCDATRRLPFENASVDTIYSSHMVEHLSRGGATTFFAEARRILRTGGVLRVSVPDLRKLASEYVEHGDADEFMRRAYVSAGELNSLRDKAQLLTVGFRHHQWMYDGQSLSAALIGAGFSQAFILKAGETKIAEPGNLDLCERQDESVYVEAIK